MTESPGSKFPLERTKRELVRLKTMRGFMDGQQPIADNATRAMTEIRRLIDSGDLAEDGRLPTERELSDRLRIGGRADRQHDQLQFPQDRIGHLAGDTFEMPLRKDHHDDQLQKHHW